MSSLAPSIRVCLRIRPLTNAEASRGDGLACYPSDHQTVRVISQTNSQQQQNVQNNSNVETHSYSFDRVFNSETSQEQLYRECDVKNCCEAALQGRGCSVIVYGQSTAGKTYTLSGSPPVRDAIANTDTQQLTGEFEKFVKDGGEISPGFVHHHHHHNKNKKEKNKTSTSKKEKEQEEKELCSPEFKNLFQSFGIQCRAGIYIVQRVSEILEQFYSSKNSSPSSYFSSSSSANPPPVVIRASMYEIYNDQVNDLLNETKNLKVRLNPNSQTFFIEHLMLVEITSVEDLFAVLAQGESCRKRSSHSDSTRSHVVFSLAIEQQIIQQQQSNNENNEIDFSNNSNVNNNSPYVNSPSSASVASAAASTSSSSSTCSVVGKIVFVDLAGSERLENFENLQNEQKQKEEKISHIPGLAEKVAASNTKSNQKTIQLAETKSINKSLFTLGKVISALAAASRAATNLQLISSSSERQQQQQNFQQSLKQLQQHIPFRDSTLTKLLMDSLTATTSSVSPGEKLGSLTLMIATVTPSSRHIEETRNTLQYATMARSIASYRHVTINNVAAKVDAGRNEMSQLKKEVEWLRRENLEMRNLLTSSNEEREVQSERIKKMLLMEKHQKVEQQEQQIENENDITAEILQQAEEAIHKASSSSAAAASGEVNSLFPNIIEGALEKRKQLFSQNSNDYNDSEENNDDEIQGSFLLPLEAKSSMIKYNNNENFVRKKEEGENEMMEDSVLENAEEYLPIDNEQQKNEVENSNSSSSQKNKSNNRNEFLLLDQTNRALERVVDDNRSLRSEVEELRRLVLEATSSASSKKSNNNNNTDNNNNNDNDSDVNSSSDFPSSHSTIPPPPPPATLLSNSSSQIVSSPLTENTQQIEKAEEQQQLNPQQQQSGQVVSGYGFRPASQTSNTSSNNGNNNNNNNNAVRKNSFAIPLSLMGLSERK